jgi:hypothetical protein
MEIESSSPIGGGAMDVPSQSTKYFRALFLEGEMSRLIRYVSPPLNQRKKLTKGKMCNEVVEHGNNSKKIED